MPSVADIVVIGGANYDCLARSPELPSLPRPTCLHAPLPKPSKTTPVPDASPAPFGGLPSWGRCAPEKPLALTGPTPTFRARSRTLSSAVEHYLDTVGVTGSNPVACTI
jgi:hypothetical protein